jgi:hypothetical protein
VPFKYMMETGKCNSCEIFFPVNFDIIRANIKHCGYKLRRKE